MHTRTVAQQRHHHARHVVTIPQRGAHPPTTPAGGGDDAAIDGVPASVPCGNPGIVGRPLNSVSRRFVAARVRGGAAT